MLLQAGPIAPSSLGLWAVTFVLGGLVVVVAWLVRRHFTFAVPVYRRVFGDEDDPTSDGHLADSESRFDRLDESNTELRKEFEEMHADLREEVDDLHGDVRKVERRQEVSISNQAAIAEELGVDLDRPNVYREGRSDRDRGD